MAARSLGKPRSKGKQVYPRARPEWAYFFRMRKQGAARGDPSPICIKASHRYDVESTLENACWRIQAGGAARDELRPGPFR